MAEFNKEVLTETSKEEDYTKIRCSVFLQALLPKGELEKLRKDWLNSQSTVKCDWWKWCFDKIQVSYNG